MCKTVENEYMACQADRTMLQNLKYHCSMPFEFGEDTATANNLLARSLGFIQPLLVYHWIQP